MNKKKCAVCGEVIKGRSDKRYCSIKCKNKFHYPGGKPKDDIVKDVNRFLQQNRKILQSVFAGEKKNKLSVPKLLLDKMGFHYDYMTGIHQNKEGKFYHYVYEYGWMSFSNQEILLIKRKMKI